MKRGRKPIVNWTDEYFKIFNLVEEGKTIENACKVRNISRSHLYKNMTDIQRKELKVLKLLQSSYFQGQTKSLTVEDIDNLNNYEF